MGRGRRRTLNRATLAALALGAGVTWNISNVNPVADSLGPRYGVSLATVGLFTTALFVTHLLVQLPSGRAADRYGRERVVAWALAVSGGCAVLVGLCFGRSWWVLMPIVLVWGVAVIADSAQFSALVTEVAPPHAVGTALTLQTSLGFLLTMVTIQLIPVIVAATLRNT